MTIQTGRFAGRKFWLKTGQSLSFGRTERADCAVPDDPMLSGLHFQIECLEDGACLRDLNSANGTLVNSQRILETQLHGGEEISAGGTRFTVDFDDTPRTSIGGLLSQRDEFPANPVTSAESSGRSPLDWDVTPEPTSPEAIELIIEHGPTSPRRERLELGQQLTVGRSPSADICIADDRLLSSVHFGIDVRRHELRIEDLGSTNGIFVDGQKVTITGLKSAQTLRAGETRFSVCFPASLPPAASIEPKNTVSDESDRLPPSVLNTPIAIADESPDDGDVPATGCLLPPTETLDLPPERVANVSGDSTATGADADDALQISPTLANEISRVSLAGVSLGSPLESPHEAAVGENATNTQQSSLAESSQEALRDLEVVILDIHQGQELLRTSWLTPGQTAIVGVDASCDEVLPAAAGVSPRHLAIVASANAARVQDLNSTSGIRLNGSIVQRAQVANGDAIQVGPYELRMRVIYRA